MPIPLEQARALVAGLRAPQVVTLFAQAHAKHVLHEVKEATENFPAFDPNLDDKVTFAVYALLAAGCSVIEQGDRAEGAAAIERAASLLYYIHGPAERDSRESGFHVLVAAMAFYAAGHYSRAFVTVRAIEEQTPAARTIAAFLRKDIVSLVDRLNEVLLRDPPQFEDQLELDEWAITVAISRAAAVALLRTLFADPRARVLYLAPFRSLALEVEHTLAATFSWLGHGVSHLYGGSEPHQNSLRT
jgi:hypothetical protein